MKKYIYILIFYRLLFSVRKTPLTQHVHYTRNSLLKRLGLLMIVSLMIVINAVAQCPSGNITLSSQELVNNFSLNYPGCQNLTYSITVNGADITILDGLSTVKNIGQSLLLNFNTQLESIEGLSNSETIGATLQLTGNHALQNLNGLSKLRSVKDLTIQSNSGLKNVDGLVSLKNINGKLQLGNNAGLTAIAGLSAVESIAEHVNISSNAELVNINGLSSLKTVGKDLTIISNPKLQNLNGLAALTSMGGGLGIGSNTQLNSVSGISGIDPATIISTEPEDGLLHPADSPSLPSG